MPARNVATIVEEQPSEEEGGVQVPIYSRFEFPGITIPEGSTVEDALAEVRARLGPDAGLADLELDDEGVAIGVRMNPPPEVTGRGRLPHGTYALPQESWRGYVSFPGEREGDKRLEVPTADYYGPASEIVERGGHVVVVIPLNFSLPQGGVPPPPAGNAP